jgi:SPX domain protein involved in polyphosphate accumulation
MESHPNKYRSEIKFIFENTKYNNIKKEILKKNFHLNHNPNIINNIYFDVAQTSYNDNIEGNFCRKKVRLRWYNRSFEDFVLEEKIKIGTAGIKNKYKIKIEDINCYSNLCKEVNKELKEQQLEPVIRNSYKREYFIKGKTRITLDSKIKYSNFHKTFNYLEKYNVLEIKFDNKNSISSQFDYIPAQRVSKYSKFQTGIEKVKLFKYL